MGIGKVLEYEILQLPMLVVDRVEKTCKQRKHAWGTNSDFPGMF
jgi:hypothetical protein